MNEVEIFHKLNWFICIVENPKKNQISKRDLILFTANYSTLSLPQ